MKYDYVIHPVDQDTYLLCEYARTCSYLLIGSKKALLIDTGCGCGNLLETVRSLADRELIVVNSHGHLDHVGANYYFPKVWIMREDEALMYQSSSREIKDTDIRRYLTGMDADFDKKELERIIAAPQVKETAYLKDGMVFELGGRTIEVIQTPGHTAGSCCFLDKTRRQLYTADTICDISILLFFSESKSVESYYRSIQRLESRQEEYDLMFPGHHKVPLDKGYLEEYRTCAERILDGTLKGQRHVEEIGQGLKASYGRIGIVYRPDRRIE